MGLTAKITGILAPTDFSPSAEEACGLAARLASRFDARLLMFHAIQTIDMALQIERTEGRTREEILNDSHDRLLVWFHSVVPEELRCFVTVAAQVAVREPAPEIAGAARASGIDLIVMATHGRSGISHLVMGSVTESVLRTAPAHVLALRTGPESRPFTDVKRILWATDLSPASEGARHYVVMLADTFSAEVCLLHVVNSTELVGTADIPVLPPTSWLAGQVATVERELASKQQEIEWLGLKACRRVTVGTPAAVIVAEAQAEPADLIIMGTHGRTGLTHVFLGSVAETVIRKAPCPVLVVQANPQTKPERPGSGIARAETGAKE